MLCDCCIVDGSGSIDLAEFNELLSSMFCSGMTRPSATEMQTLFVEIDTNHNNTIEMDEWLDFLINTCVKSMDPTQLIKDFALFEGISSSSKQPRVGRISRTDLVLGMQTYAPDKLITYGKSRSQAIESSHQAELLALHTLLAAIPFDADDKFDYAAYVRANTGVVGTGKL